jgi:hypothetical protein
VKLQTLPALAGALAVLATALPHTAQALGRIAEVTVVDRDSGRELPIIRHRGEHWVAGRPGARYAIRIRNALGQRVLAVTSVDGINVVTGETAAPDQPGYVFDPWSAYDIGGWRKSDAQIAAFEFTAVPRSYAARTGRPDNVGVIGVALFRERRPPPLASREKSVADATASAPAEAAGNSRLESQRAPGLGTGHGRREDSRVTQVDFERAMERPDEVLRLRYDSRANLVVRGVIREPRPDARPDPFPGEPQLGYVPDP